MLKPRLDGILAGTALALLLASSAVAGPDGTAAHAGASIESRIPVPQPAAVKPPTQADLGLVPPPDAADRPTPAEAPAATSEGVAFPETEHAQAPAGDATAGLATEGGAAKLDPATTGAVTPPAAPG